MSARHCERAAGVVLLGAAMAASPAGAARAQTPTTPTHGVTTDSRWYPWLGCWAADSTGASSPLECLVPVAGSNAVDAISLDHGKMVERDRLDATGRPHKIRVQGCDGTETARLSENGRRVFLHSTYTCGAGIQGTSARLFSLLPNGDWLDVTDVQSGGGSLVHVDRRHDVGVPASVPRDIAAALDGRQLAVTTARANAVSALSVEDVVEAVRATSAPTVEAWLVATKQRFNLDSRQISTLTQANVPPAVVRAMLGSATGERNAQQSAYGSAASDEYLNTPTYNPGAAGVPLPAYGVSPIMECPAVTCYTGVYGTTVYPMFSGAYNPYASYVPYPVYTAPYIVHRGGARYGRPERPAAPPPPRAPIGRRPR